MAGQIAIAFFQRFKVRERAKDGKVRRPDVGGNKDGLQAAIQRDFQQITAVQAQNGPAVAMQVSNGLQAVSERFRVLQAGKQNHMVNLPRFFAAFVYGADLAGNNEAGRGILSANGVWKDERRFQTV